MSKDTRTAFGQMFDQQRETSGKLEEVTKDLKELLDIHRRCDQEGDWGADHYCIPEALSEELDETTLRLRQKYL